MDNEKHFQDDTVMEQDRDSFDGLADGSASWHEKMVMEFIRKEQMNGNTE